MQPWESPIWVSVSSFSGGFLGVSIIRTPYELYYSTNHTNESARGQNAGTHITGTRKREGRKRNAKKAKPKAEKPTAFS
jgi:hypothetical protein|eukprot:2983513-Prymnesium_polylepis.1